MLETFDNESDARAFWQDQIDSADLVGDPSSSPPTDNIMKNTINELAEQYSFEELAAALYHKGKRTEYHKITDKTKWRELVMAEKLGHTAFEKISAGAGSDKYGADAINESTGVMSEYKTKAIEDAELRNLLQLPKGNKGKTFAPLTVGGVYNGAYSHDIIDTYADKDHYFGIFYEEQCVMIIKPKTEEVLCQLHEEIDRRTKSKKKGSTNLNTVNIKLYQTDLYDVAYRKQEFFDQRKVLPENFFYEEGVR